MYDIMMKPVDDVNLTKYSQDYLKTKSKARLSILILSKADPTKGIKALYIDMLGLERFWVSFAEKQQRVGP